jgi:hypothetical protein
MLSQSLYPPRIFIDGYQVGDGWGCRVFASWTGRHHINVHSQAWEAKIWNTDIVVDVYPGHVLELEFMAPKSLLLGVAALYYAPHK